jgi:hypothetical protein
MAALWLAALFTLHGAAAAPGVKVADSAPPADIAEELRGLLDSKSFQLDSGDGLLYEFWFRKDLPLARKPNGGDALAAIDETTYLGTVKVHKDTKDFKDDEVISGVYTMRLGIQPTDGNHLGTSPFPYFAILVPAKYDKELTGVSDHDTLADLSAQDTATEHPNILSLQPALEADQQTGDFPRLGEGGDNWKWIHFRLPATVKDGGEKLQITFQLVYEGHGQL